MREIKFRAWYIPTGKMVTSDKLESINFDVKTLGVYMPIENRGFNKLRTSDFELMQYTGLKDKNGKEIYEGDILKTKHGVFEVKWDKYQFILDGFYCPSNDNPSDYFSEQGWDEVIGNIYENKELITHEST